MFIQKDPLSQVIHFSYLRRYCLCTLADTNNVMTSLSNYSKITTYAKPANSSKVAYDIVRGGALRLREVFSPYLIVKFLFLFNTVAPNLLQSLQNYLYS